MLGNTLKSYSPLEKAKLILFVIFLSVLPYHVWLSSISLSLLLLFSIPDIVKKQFWSGFFEKRFFLILPAYFLWCVISLLWTSNLGAGFKIIETSLALLILPLIIHGLPSVSINSFKLFLKAFVLGCLVALLYCCFNAIWRITTDFPYKWIEAFTYEQFASGIGIQPIYFAMYLVWSLLILVIMRFFFSPLFKAGIDVFLMIMFFVAVLMLSSRMEVLAMMTVLIWLGFVKARELKKLWIGVLVSAVLLTAVILVVSLNPTNRARFAEMLDFKSDYTQNRWGGRSIRLQKWKYTSQLILEQPIFGTGIGDGQDALQRIYKSNDFELGYENKFHSHNQYLQSLLMLGVFGLALFLFALIFPLFSRSSKQNLLLKAFVLLFALSCITESMLLRQKGVVLLACFLVLLAAKGETLLGEQHSSEASSK